MKLILCFALIILSACTPIRSVVTERGTLRIIRATPPPIGTIAPRVLPTVDLPTVTPTPKVSE